MFLPLGFRIIPAASFAAGIFVWFLNRFSLALASFQPRFRQGDAIHIPYTYHTHTIPMSMATVWHQWEKSEADPCQNHIFFLIIPILYSIFFVPL